MGYKEVHLQFDSLGAVTAILGNQEAMAEPGLKPNTTPKRLNPLSYRSSFPQPQVSSDGDPQPPPLINNPLAFGTVLLLLLLLLVLVPLSSATSHTYPIHYSVLLCFFLPFSLFSSLYINHHSKSPFLQPSKLLITPNPSQFLICSRNPSLWKSITTTAEEEDTCRRSVAGIGTTTFPSLSASTPLDSPPLPVSYVTVTRRRTGISTSPPPEICTRTTLLPPRCSSFLAGLGGKRRTREPKRRRSSSIRKWITYTTSLRTRRVRRGGGRLRSRWMKTCTRSRRSFSVHPVNRKGRERLGS